MAAYELSFTPTFYNESLNVPRHVSKSITQKLKVLEGDPISALGDAKKIKGYANVYRVRVGDYRVFYSVGQGWVKLLSVRKRDERTYADELPAAPAPAAAPDAAALAPHAEAAPPVYTPPAYVPPPAASAPLPYALTPELLAQWRIPEDHWPAVLRVRTEDDLLDLSIPERYVSRLLDTMFPRALEAIATQPEYRLAQAEDVALFETEDLGAFLLKLSPEQAALVAQQRRGPTLVKGGPGTGKSTLALYRVRHLIERGVGPILFTTYTNALVSYSEQLLAQLLGRDPAACGVKVGTVDAQAMHYYAKAHGWANFATDGQIEACLTTALAEAEIPAANVFDRQVRQQALARLGSAYILQEFNDVLLAWGVERADDYVAMERRGRRTPLKASTREALWAVYTRWRELMAAQRLVTTAIVRLEALAVARALPAKPYQALIIDEAQDLPPVAIRLLCALVATPDHLYLTADAAQSIYQRGFSWRQIHADLTMAGRTLVLRKNYRNTAQIAAACASILDAEVAGDAESIQQELSPILGEPPRIQLVASEREEVEAVRAFLVDAARHYRLPIFTGAVLCQGQRTGQQLAQRLTALGIPAVFQSGKQIDITVRQVKVLTIHSAKGLEFPFVAVVGLDAGRLPRQDDDLPAEEQAAADEAQRRLFFVGSSRAMRALLICGSRQTPSPFLDALTPPLWERKDHL
ncbi:AAA family ATPase [Chloroflexia bacterium SDU3-3]|nr:AAA family ATPase [Chloroflexia bacterium SDU3-3]